MSAELHDYTRQAWRPRREIFTAKGIAYIHRPKPAKIYAAPIGPLIHARWRLYRKPPGPYEPWRGDNPNTSPVLANFILKNTAKKWGVSVIDVLSHRRDAITVIARQETMYRLRHETRWSTPRIGHFLGGRDHTTVLHGVDRYAAYRAGDPLPVAVQNHLAGIELMTEVERHQIKLAKAKEVHAKAKAELARVRAEIWGQA